MFLILDQVLTNLIFTPLSVSFLIIQGLRRDINATLQMLMLPLLSLSHISLALVLPKKNRFESVASSTCFLILSILPHHLFLYLNCSLRRPQLCYKLYIIFPCLTTLMPLSIILTVCRSYIYYLQFTPIALRKGTQPYVTTISNFFLSIVVPFFLLYTTISNVSIHKNLQDVLSDLGYRQALQLE